MPAITRKDIRPPYSDATLKKMSGALTERAGYQIVAADADVVLTHNGNPVLFHPAQVFDVEAIVLVPPAAGESMSVNVMKSTDGGTTFTSILTAPYVFTNAVTVAKQIVSLNSLLDPTKVDLGVGDFLVARLDYTAGGGAAPMAATAVKVWSTIPNT